MAASIAKLAIQISTDTRAMSDGFRVAQMQVQRFQATASQSGGAVGALNAGMLRLGAAGAALLSIQKVGQFLKHAATAAAELQDRLDAVRGVASDDSPSKAYKRLWDTIAVVGLPVVRKASEALNNMLDAFEAGGRREGIHLDTQKFIKDLEAQEAAMKKAAEQAKALAKAEADAAEERIRAHQRLRDEANSISESLRTPLEEFEAQQKKLQSLFQGGFLSGVDLTRGVKKAADDFRNATKAATEFKSAVRVGAVEQGSQAAVSSVANATNASVNNDMRRIQERMLEAQLQSNRLLADSSRNAIRAVPGKF